MILSLESHKALFPNRPVERYYEGLEETYAQYEIFTPKRLRAFLAQIGHESNEFRAVEEYASGKAYEGRRALGNTQPGDGQRFKGRGLIQITGRANYAELAEALGIDFISSPDLLKNPRYACLSAGWFWHKRKLNALADQEAFEQITRRINGGLNGYPHRLALYQKAKDIIW